MSERSARKDAAAALLMIVRGRLRSAWHFSRAVPLCATVVAALWVVAVLTHSLMTGPSPAVTGRFGIGVRPLSSGAWWAPITSAFFSSGLLGYAAITVAFLVACAPLERRIGTLRATVLFVVSQVIGSLVAVGLIAFGQRTGDIWAGQLASAVDVGASPGAVGLLFGASRALRPLWRRRLRVLLAAILLTTALYAGDFSDVVRLVAAVVGLALGALIVREHPGPAHRQIHSDRRALVALIVAAAAIGPVTTLLTSRRFGPLSALDFLFLPSLGPSDVLQWCSRVAAGDPARCETAATAFLVQGIGPLVQTLLPVLVLAVLAEGLRRGRRAACIGAVTVNIGLAAIGAFLSRRQLADLVEDKTIDSFGGSELWIIRLAPTALPLAIAALVFVYRSEFPIRMPYAARRRWLTVTVAAAALVAAGYLVVGWFVRDGFEPAPGLGALVASLPERFAPSGFVGGHSSFFPISPAAIALYRWTGTAFWTVVLVATVISFWRVRGAEGAVDRAAAAAILRRDSGPNTMAYMTLWRGNHYFFSADGSSVIAYRVIAGVAVTTGDPIGPHPAAAVEEFVSYCAGLGWTPCFFSVTERTADLLRYEGFGTLRVASDSVLDPSTLTFAGKPWQHLRAAFHRAERLGVTAKWSAFEDLPAEVIRQVEVIDRQWLAEKQLPEMGFTLGGIRELKDPAVRCVVALDAAGRVYAITSWLPGYRGGRVVGWTLDFMRHPPDSFTGATEFLIGTALTTFREEGARYVSLSGVPLVSPESDVADGTLGRAIDAIAGVLEPVYGFRSLFTFKAKFLPTYVPLFMAYPDPSALPTVTNAVLHAYVPHVGPAQFTHLLRRLLRAPS